MKWYWLVLFLGITITTTTAQEENLLASIERTTCYGNCPYYSAKIYKDGKVLYRGKRHVERLGKHEAQLSTEQLAALKAKAKAANYEQLAPKYPLEGLGMIDFPLCITQVQTAAGLKTVYNRHDAPFDLIAYEEFLDELLEDLEWQCVR